MENKSQSTLVVWRSPSPIGFLAAKETGKPRSTGVSIVSLKLSRAFLGRGGNGGQRAGGGVQPWLFLPQYNSAATFLT